MDNSVCLTSVFPWRIDQDNAAVLCVVDARGEIVYCEDWVNLPNYLESSAREAIILRARANARYMVACSEKTMGKETTAGLNVGREFAVWQPIETAPRDGTPIVGWCVHAADPYYLEDHKRLTIYGGHTEGLRHVEDGPHVVVWGGAYDDSTWEMPGAYLPDWWFLAGTSFEVTANPTHWMPLPAPPVSAQP